MTPLLTGLGPVALGTTVLAAVVAVSVVAVVAQDSSGADGAPPGLSRLSCPGV